MKKAALSSTIKCRHPIQRSSLAATAPTAVLKPWTLHKWASWLHREFTLLCPENKFDLQEAQLDFDRSQYSLSVCSETSLDQSLSLAENHEKALFCSCLHFFVCHLCSRSVVGPSFLQRRLALSKGR